MEGITVSGGGGTPRSTHASTTCQVKIRTLHGYRHTDIMQTTFLGSEANNKYTMKCIYYTLKKLRF